MFESILIRKKILWRINFVLIGFLVNASLFKKSQNEYKNPSFLHKTMCIESNHSSMKMWNSLSTFMDLNSRRLWQYTPAFFPSILQSSFCGILLEQGFERCSLQQSPIQHPTQSTYGAIPISGRQKLKNCMGQVGTVHRVCENLNFSFFKKFPDNGSSVRLGVVVVQKPNYIQIRPFLVHMSLQGS